MNNVYVDILFLINFCMDFLALYLAGGAMRTERRTGRLFFAAALGAAYAVLDVLYCKNHILSLATGLLVSFVLCLVAFYDRRGVALFKHFLLFWGISLLLGGAVTTLYTLLGGIFGETTGTPTRTDVLLTLAGVASIAIAAAERFFMRHTEERAVRLSLSVGERSATLLALCDSGNLLTDPVTARPVLIVARQAAGFLPTCYRFPDESGCRLKDNDTLFPRPVFAEGHDGRRMLWLVSGVEIHMIKGKRRIPLSGAVAIDGQNQKYGECDALIPAALLP